MTDIRYCMVPHFPRACSVHAASVLQLTHMLIFHGGIPDAILPAALKLGTYWSAIVHDFEHGGLNNDFLIKTASPLAVLYNDQSPLENHHCAAAVKQLFDLRHNYLPVRAMHVRPFLFVFAGLRGVTLRYGLPVMMCNAAVPRLKRSVARPCLAYSRALKLCSTLCLLA